jgi:hypothetical protein
MLLLTLCTVAVISVYLTSRQRAETSSQGSTGNYDSGGGYEYPDSGSSGYSGYSGSDGGLDPDRFDPAPTQSPYSPGDVYGDGGADNAPQTSPPGSAGHSLRSFLDDCAKDVNDWQRGAAVYPRILSIELNESATYDAGIDIRGSGTGNLRAQFDPAQTYAEVPVDVRCGLGARLVSDSDSLEVDKTDWHFQQFDQPGTTHWSWTVKAKKAEGATLRLELRPAVAVAEGGYVVPAEDGKYSPTSGFTTQVQVEASPLQHLYAWWDENWPKIVGIGAALGAAIGGVLAWIEKLKKQRGEAGATRSSQQASAARRGKSKSRTAQKRT